MTACQSDELARIDADDELQIAPRRRDGTLRRPVPIGARALQGVGAAVLAPSTLSMLQTSFEALPERTRAVAYYGAVAGIGASLGLVLDGLITDVLPAPTDQLTGVALPMVLIGAGQGATLSPLTAAGISGVDPQDAGAASGLVNVAHQLGGSLGLGILVTLFAAAGSAALGADELLAHRVATALTVGTGMLGLALILVVSLIVRPAPPGR